MRPILNVSFRDKKEGDITIPALQNALEFLMLVMKRFMLVPKFCEQWICVIDMADLSAFKIDLKIIKSIVDISRVNFMGFLHRIFLFDVSLSCRIGLQAIKQLMAKRTSDKIQMIPQGNTDLLFQ